MILWRRLDYSARRSSHCLEGHRCQCLIGPGGSARNIAWFTGSRMMPCLSPSCGITIKGRGARAWADFCETGNRRVGESAWGVLGKEWRLSAMGSATWGVRSCNFGMGGDGRCSWRSWRVRFGVGFRELVEHTKIQSPTPRGAFVIENDRAPLRREAMWSAMRLAAAMGPAACCSQGRVRRQQGGLAEFLSKH